MRSVYRRFHTVGRTFFHAIEKALPYLVDLGVNAIEIMPIADFPGNRNWGYDGVSPLRPCALLWATG